ncbi:MAG: SGNH/GDSL hydrolase family protein, partial [Bacteroidota bacterium]
YGFTPFGKSKQPIISKGIDDYNMINQRITKDYGIKYYSITSISRNGLKDAGLIANDKLHPSGKQYSLWVDLILEDEALVRIFN